MTFRRIAIEPLDGLELLDKSSRSKIALTDGLRDCIKRVHGDVSRVASAITAAQLGHAS